MPSYPKSDSPEREQTDESLRAERARTDQALAKRQQAVAEDADEVVQRARDTADAVLSAARDQADLQLASADPDVAPETLARERGLEDEALRGERAAADETLRMEREETAQALALLLPLERVKTDRYLLTERARSDDAVANRDDFMGIVSHDLRNLLGGIVMSAGMLSKSAPADHGGEQSRHTADRIQRYAARMNRLIGDLVDVASIDAGKLALTPMAGDASNLLAEAVEMFQAAAGEKRIRLETEIVASPLPAVFDHDRILQVLANLIANAIKFSDQGGTIRVRVDAEDDRVRLSVHDTGGGVPAAMLERIFERFWQVGQNDQRGSGLGLYISRCIVNAHGGRIWAESASGQGTVVCLTLPRVKSAV